MGLRRWVGIGLGALSLAACAGPQHPWSDRTLCRLRADPPLAAEPDARWIEVLLQGFDRQTGLVTSPAIDCSGTQVRWEAPALSCQDSAVAQAMLPVRPLGKEDVAVSALDAHLSIVWVMTNRYGSGDALGPVAIVDRRGEDLVVRALGSLRAFPTRASFSLRRLGTGEVLVAEGERCATRDADTCERAARILPLQGDRFAGDVIRSETGGCLGPSLVHLTRVETDPLDSGLRRRFELSASLVFAPDVLQVQELVVVRDSDPRQPGNAPRLFRRAEDAYTVRLVGDRLVGAGAPLWPRMRNESANGGGFGRR